MPVKIEMRVRSSSDAKGVPEGPRVKSSPTPRVSKRKSVPTIPAKASSAPTPEGAPRAPAASHGKGQSSVGRESRKDIAIAMPAPVTSATNAVRSSAKVRGQSARVSSVKQDKKINDRRSRVRRSEPGVSPPRDETLPEFDPTKFTPGCIPNRVRRGEDEYMIVVSGVQDTGLCGGYWGNTENLGSKRRRKSVNPLQLRWDDKERRGSTVDMDTPQKTPSINEGVTTQHKHVKKQVSSANKKMENKDSRLSKPKVTPEQKINYETMGVKMKTEYTPSVQRKIRKTMENKETTEKKLDEEETNSVDSDDDSCPNKTLPMSKS